MGKRKIGISLGLVMLVAAFFVVGLTGTALADRPGSVLDGPSNPALGDPVGTDISPHGGYSASTDYCLQCHAVHAGTNDYSFLRLASISAVCATCHWIGVTGSQDPAYVLPGAQPGPAFDAGSGGTGPLSNGGNANTAAVPAQVGINLITRYRLPSTIGAAQTAVWAGCTLAGVYPSPARNGCPADVAVVQLAAANSFSVGDRVWIRGVTSTATGQPAGSSHGFNGTWVVTAISGDTIYRPDTGGTVAVGANEFALFGALDTTPGVADASEATSATAAITNNRTAAGNGTTGNTPNQSYVASAGDFAAKTNTTVTKQAVIGNPANPGPGTASVRTAYDVDAPASGHEIGTLNPPDGAGTFPNDSLVDFTEPEWSYGWRSASLTNTTAAGTSPGAINTTTGALNYPSAVAADGAPNDGLNCVSCHTPHGEFGQLINKDYVWTHDPLDDPDSGAFGAYSGQPLTQLSALNRPGGVGNGHVNNYESPATDSEYVLQKVGNGTVVYAFNTTNNPLMSDGATCVGTQNTGVSPSVGIQVGAAGYCIRPGSQAMAWLVGPTTSGTMAANTDNLVGAPAAGTGYWSVCVFRAADGASNYDYNRCAPWRIEAQDGGFARPDGGLVSAYGYKLLSAYPNHSWEVPTSWGADFRIDDQPGWCGKCHPTHIDQSFPALWTSEVRSDWSLPAGTFHNHPTACTYCHGNPAYPQGGSTDFPHTSTNTGLLKQYPDGLCIQCHTAGLP